MNGEQIQFYNSKQIVTKYGAKRNTEVFFSVESIKKASNDRSYVKPIIIRADNERYEDIDFNFNLNNSTIEVIKRHPSRDYWVISIDASTTKQFIDKEGIAHDFHPSETMYVMNTKAINKLKEMERATIIGFDGEL